MALGGGAGGDAAAALPRVSSAFMPGAARAGSPAWPIPRPVGALARQRARLHHPQRILRRISIAGIEHLSRIGRAHQLYQTIDTAIAEPKAEFGRRRTELGVVVSLDSLLARELLELRMESVTLVDTVSEDSTGWE